MPSVLATLTDLSNYFTAQPLDFSEVTDALVELYAFTVPACA